MLVKVHYEILILLCFTFVTSSLVSSCTQQNIATEQTVQKYNGMLKYAQKQSQSLVLLAYADVLYTVRRHAIVSAARVENYIYACS